MTPKDWFASIVVTLAQLAYPAASLAQGNPAASTGSDDAVQTIVVSGQKMSVKTLVDRKVYDVSTDIQSSFGTVSDVLGVIPSVDVDPDGTVSYRGDSNVLILIDGKPSALLSGPAAGDNLRAIPARDIERIEVLSTPPAQFKAEGVSGVINIILRKNRPEGIAGTVQAGLGDSGRASTASEVSYHGRGLTASISAGFRHDIRRRRIESDVVSAGGTSADGIRDSSSLQEMQRRQVPTVGAKAEYALDDKQSVSAAASWMRRGGLRTFTQANSTSLGDTLLASNGRESAGHDPQTDLDARLGYDRKFDRDGEELNVAFHRSAARQRERYDYTNYSLVPAQPDGYNYLASEENETNTEVSADYTRPFAAGGELKLGHSFEQTDYRFTNHGADLDPVTGVEVLDPNLNNDFRFRYRINAAYASYQEKSDFWTTLVGLRAEYTDTDSLLITGAIASRSNYFHVFPSLHLVRKLSETTTLSFGASRRIRRSDPDDLNPYVDREYTPELRAGNPGLRPQLTQSYEFGFGFEGARASFQTAAYYRRNSNSTTEVTQILGDGFSLTTKANLPKTDAAGLELSANGRLLPKLSYTLSANPYYVEIDSRQAGAASLRSTRGINAKLKLDYRPSARHSAQLTFSRTDKRLTPQGYVSAINIANVGYKRFVTDDLSLVATISDIFNGQRSERIIDTSTESGSYLRVVKGRVIYAGLIYSFGSRKNDDQFEYDP